eukprot:COSAG06_NODE_4078_length_4596_cov_3453.381281_2_plen_56_part_00
MGAPKRALVVSRDVPSGQPGDWEYWELYLAGAGRDRIDRIYILWSMPISRDRARK